MKINTSIPIENCRIKVGINQLGENRYEVIFPRMTTHKFRNHGNWRERHEIADWLNDNVPVGELQKFSPVSVGGQLVWVVHVSQYTTAALMWLRWCDGWKK